MVLLYDSEYLLQCTNDEDYWRHILSFSFWPLYCLNFFDLRLLKIYLFCSFFFCSLCYLSFDLRLLRAYFVLFLLVIVLSEFLRFTVFEGILCTFSCGHCVVFPSSIYSFWLHFSIFKLVLLINSRIMQYKLQIY